jgi:membrane protease YdiL (CAAX protease family)
MPLTVALRKSALAEALLVFAAILFYIWRLRFTHPWSWLWVVGAILGSHAVRRERAQSLGFRVANFAHCVRTFGIPLFALALVILSVGLLLGAVRPIGIEAAVRSFILYLPWGLFQQYLLNGYFLNRFDVALSRTASSVLASALFAVAHLPNWFLMLVTLAAGQMAIWAYRRYRNLFFLGLAHATVGFLLFIVVPDSVTHHLRVGPEWNAGEASSAV